MSKCLRTLLLSAIGIWALMQRARGGAIWCWCSAGLRRTNCLFVSLKGTHCHNLHNQILKSGYWRHSVSDWVVSFASDVMLTGLKDGRHRVARNVLLSGWKVTLHGVASNVLLSGTKHRLHGVASNVLLSGTKPRLHRVASNVMLSGTKPRLHRVASNALLSGTKPRLHRVGNCLSFPFFFHYC